MKRNFRKPLILMTPKSLLRHKRAVSPVEEFSAGQFHEILDDPAVDSGRVRRVLLCSGKVFYDLLERRGKNEEAALIRIEQFYPFPVDSLRQTLARYRQAKEWVWVQEESLNMGGWTFMETQLRALGYAPQYVGRDASASPAAGSRRVHLWEQTELVNAAISGPVPHLVKASADGRKSTSEEQRVARDMEATETVASG
jgi:2-oxoglutarate dehydrogenase E1 component